MKNSVDARFVDINMLMSIIKEKERVDRQLILKSSLMLMLYNAVEGTFSNLLSVFFDELTSARCRIGLLPDKLQDTIYQYHLKQIGTDKNKLKEFSLKDDVSMCALSYLEINKYLKLFSGNLDSRSIKDISKRIGINIPPDRLNEPVLLIIKNHRNKLAHGESKFSDACQDITIGEVFEMADKTKRYLDELMEIYESYLIDLLHRQV